MRKALFHSFFILLMMIPVFSMGQTKTVTGRVTGTSGVAVPSATVQQKGTNTAVTADENGEFSISITGNNPVLVISSVNFRPQEIAVGNRTQLNVELEATGELSEVIVTTAFGFKAQKKTLGYSVQEVSSKDLLEGKNNGFIGALQGKVNGINVTSSGGAAGSGSDIVIRGLSSLSPTANNQPLIIIDGMPIDNSTIVGNVMPSAGSNSAQAGSRDQFGVANRGLDINPEDIESISVLKGAGATALYGLSASNGVIIITTKKGTAGRMAVSFNTSYADDYLTKFPEIQTKYREGSNGRRNINANGTLATPLPDFWATDHRRKSI